MRDADCESQGMVLDPARVCGNAAQGAGRIASDVLTFSLEPKSPGDNGMAREGQPGPAEFSLHPPQESSIRKALDT
jgi:hypothetical protein